MLDGDSNTGPVAVGPVFDDDADAARSAFGRAVTILAALEFLARFVDDDDLARLVRVATGRALAVMVERRQAWERPR